MTIAPITASASLAQPLLQDRRLLKERVWHTVQAIFRYIGHLFMRLLRALFSCEKPFLSANYPSPHKTAEGLYAYKLEDLPWHKDEKSEGLFFFVHGLGSNPLRWADYLLDCQKALPRAHYLAPYVPLRGNCILEIAAKPLLSIVQSYVNKYPGKPLYLFGFSNGARLVTYIEAELQLPEGSQLHIVSIAGPHHGSQVVNMAIKTNMAAMYKMDRQLQNELTYHSTFSRNLLRLREERAAARSPSILVKHFFYASTEDEVIRPCKAALPEIAGMKTVIHGYNHSGIVAAVRQRVWQHLGLHLH